MKLIGDSLRRRAASFVRSVPLTSSSPMLINPTRGLRTPRIAREYIAPMIANCDRGGEGRVRFTGVSVLSERGAEMRTIVSGQNVVFRFDYDIPGGAPLADAAVQIKFFGSFGQPLFGCSSLSSSREPLFLAPGGCLLCTVPKFPLMPGLYTYTLSGARSEARSKIMSPTRARLSWKTAISFRPASCRRVPSGIFWWSTAGRWLDRITHSRRLIGFTHQDSGGWFDRQPSVQRCSRASAGPSTCATSTRGRSSAREPRSIPPATANGTKGIRLFESGKAPRGGYDLICRHAAGYHMPLALAALDERPSAILIEKPLCGPDLEARRAMDDARGGTALRCSSATITWSAGPPAGRTN